MSDKIFYKEGYKYQLVKDFNIQTPIKPPKDLAMEYYVLTQDGMLYVSRGFAWNGADGPTIDTKSSMRASLVHDCMCQLMKERKMDYKFAPQVHAFFEQMCREDGMGGLRASIWHWGVRFGQGGNPEDKDEVVVQEAP